MLKTTCFIFLLLLSINHTYSAVCNTGVGNCRSCQEANRDFCEQCEADFEKNGQGGCKEIETESDDNKVVSFLIRIAIFAVIGLAIGCCIRVIKKKFIESQKA